MATAAPRAPMRGVLTLHVAIDMALTQQHGPQYITERLLHPMAQRLQSAMGEYQLLSDQISNVAVTIQNHVAAGLMFGTTTVEGFPVDAAQVLHWRMEYGTEVAQWMGLYSPRPTLTACMP